jgi:hypothetical protein
VEGLLSISTYIVTEKNTPACHARLRALTARQFFAEQGDPGTEIEIIKLPRGMPPEDDNLITVWFLLISDESHRERRRARN